jgi:hypothetical protein
VLLKDHQGEQRCLKAWAATKAKRRSLVKMCKIAGWSKSTMFRRRDDGAARIAGYLNSRGVAVR